MRELHARLLVAWKIQWTLACRYSCKIIVKVASVLKVLVQAIYTYATTPTACDLEALIRAYMLVLITTTIGSK